MISRLLLLVALAAVLSPAALAADDALIAAAKKEGQVTWYTTQIVTQFGRPAIDAFQKKYGIKVDAIRGDSVELATRLLAEAQADHVQADVVDGTGAVPALKRAGIVMRWLPDRAQSLAPEYRDKDGYWVATNLYIHTPAYNTDLVPKGSAPKDWQDLLDPKWRHKMAWAAHGTTSSALGFIGLVLDERGAEQGRAYLAALARQEIIPVGGSARALVDQAISGEFPIVLQVFNHQPVISARQGAPVDWIAMNPAMAILSVASVTQKAPHPNAGKLLVDFFVSDEGQTLFRDGDYIPVAPDIPPRDPALRPDGTKFRARFYSPEQIDAAMPGWQKVYDEMFK